MFTNVIPLGKTLRGLITFPLNKVLSLDKRKSIEEQLNVTFERGLKGSSHERSRRRRSTCGAYKLIQKEKTFNIQMYNL